MPELMFYCCVVSFRSIIAALRWVWISSGTHLRTRAILGDDSGLLACNMNLLMLRMIKCLSYNKIVQQPNSLSRGTRMVQAGNCIATRFVLLAVLAIVLGADYVVPWMWTHGLLMFAYIVLCFISMLNMCTMEYLDLDVIDGAAARLNSQVVRC